MRSEMSEATEATLKNCNSIALLRKAGEQFKEEICKSLQSTTTLLSDEISRLELKEKKFKMYESCSSEDIHAFWEVLLLVEPLLTRTDTRKKDVSNKDSLKAFYEHCCHSLRHYFFSIKKWGEEQCEICKPLRMSKEEFAKMGNNECTCSLPGKLLLLYHTQLMQANFTQDFCLERRTCLATSLTRQFWPFRKPLVASAQYLKT